MSKYQQGSARARIDAAASELSASETRVARFILEHAEQALLLSAAQVAELTGTSDTTVVRASRSLGFTGWTDLRRAIGAEITQITHPAARLSTRLNVTKRGSTRSLIATVFEEARERLEISQDDIVDTEFERAVEALRDASMIHTFGVGASAACASYLSTKLARIGLRARQASGMGFTFADDLMLLRTGDALVLFAPGRPFTELDLALAEARRLGVCSVLFTGRHRHEYDSRADIVIRCAGSAGGLTGETLSALVAADALTLAISQQTAAASKTASQHLNGLRRELRRPASTADQHLAKEQ
ncbi:MULTISPECIES: MurR/RpiR family transcriptional regulator [Leucobacter]|uniref:MurR/RpiR family transcriptional regulator n=1 Tax=Leucobacter TaxID=55968 RepID=UPI000E653B52|nr:MurR/RpiR family transcriptional regulator [Leucobacter aridicollis]UTX53856.1 MurR/RpiR family transcriptional regulator [Leucobacter aridicollis]